MRRKGYVILLLCLVFLIIFLSVKTSKAFDLITAQEAYDMVSMGEATLVDVRTLEEYIFVGSPALDPGGDPIAYLISWEFLEGTDENGNIIYKINPDFDALLEQTFGDDKSQALIIICRSGNRSSHAAKRIEDLGFINVYEVDNKLKELASFPGGRGGVQGSGYKGLYNGYRGYPGRLSGSCDDLYHKVETTTNNIDDEHDSVAWMDTGLPITQEVDPEKIPKLKKAESINSRNESYSQSYNSMSYYNTLPFMWSQTPQGFLSKTYFTPFTLSQSSFSGFNGRSANFFNGLTQTFYSANQGFFYNSFIPGISLVQIGTVSNLPPPSSQTSSECGGG